jgi:transcription-repair coupling factor (superfamily II helicase)
MRDLEIRGAGNLLGSEQSGHITAVGFELYCQLLKQSVSALKGEPVKPRVEVNVRLDFLSLNPTEIPLEKKDEEGEAPPGSADALPVAKTRAAPGTPESATIPYNYISDARQRIEIYRKLAQATDKQALQELEKEVRDRFGPLPRPITLLLLVGELKVLAAERGITAIEVKDDRLMLTRNNDYIMVGSKFPRVTKPHAEGRLKEIKKLLTVL